ncbi:MAG: stage 0 sporulation family protein [Lachnospiraceae bacterium]|nr:stage 0 sporulation family protein [Lachnospiraceae bacterium]
MVEVVGIRFKKAGKVYYFDPDGLKIEEGQYAIVETARGVEFGGVVKGNTLVKDEEVFQPLKKVMRVATDEDKKQEEEDKIKEQEAFAICEEKINKHSLVMKLVDVEITFDHNKLIFYFTSDGRVDFRELVKELAAVFRTRIELRQIGVRDEAKMLNGIGICGRSLCCATFLGDFTPVSIKMAKEQNLSLNPTKISGICGRLMCCLKYEEDVYEELNKNLPNVGDTISTPDGTGDILSVNVLMQQVKAVVRKKENDPPTIGFYKVEEIEVLRSKKAKKQPQLEQVKKSVAAENVDDELLDLDLED